MSNLVVEVVTTAGTRAPGLAAWLASIAPARARGTMTVAIVSDARVRALNRKFRKKDKPTDVLSFPATGGSPRRLVRRSEEREGGSGGAAEAGYLGDVVIASGVAARQARQARHALGTELRVLALHGLLHLLGYDHEHDDGRMARLERRLRRRGGLREGLIERA